MTCQNNLSWCCFADVIQFGNTCYCNSILQALYASPPFRHFVEAYPDIQKPYNALGGDIAHEPIPPPAPEVPKPSTVEPATVASPAKEKGRGVFGLGKSKPAPQAPKPTLQPAAPAPPPIVLPHDPNFPDMTLFSTIQTLFSHMSTSLPHHPAAPKTPVAANGQTNATGSNAASLPSASLVQAANGQPGVPGQPQGPSLLASLPPPSTPRGGGPYAAGTLGRGVVRPEDVLRTVRKHHMMFAGQGQQDAHEFLGFFLNQLDEEVARLDNQLRETGDEVTDIKDRKTFVQQLFHGDLVNETRCLNCETTSRREESFLDLSIDIEQHSSLTACLRQFSHSEMLCSTNKFYCETCCSLVEAERRMRIKSLPNILGLHLKRFRQDEMGRLHKLFYRVTFPLQLRVPCTTEDTDDGERLYELFAVVVHIGNGPSHGHYVTVVRSGNQWVMCDDENVEPIEESDLANYFGDNITGAGYVLFYQAVDLDLLNLGLKKLPKPRVITPIPEAVAAAVHELSDEGIMASSSEKSVTPPLTASAKVQTPLAIQTGSTDSFPLNGHAAEILATPQSRATPTPSSRRESNASRGPAPSSIRDTSMSRSPTEKSAKWYSLNKKKDSGPSASNGSLPSTADSSARVGLRRQSTTTTLNTVSTQSTVPQPDAAVPDHFPRHQVATPDANPVDLTSSMISSTSGGSSSKSGSFTAPPVAQILTNVSNTSTSQAASQAASPATTQPPIATRSPATSQPPPTTRAHRSASTASGTSLGKDANGYAGGGGLSRRISGATGFTKLARTSSSAFKIGFGKKKVDEGN